MFLSRVFGRALFGAAAKSEATVSAAAAYSTVARNPLEEFFEADRKPDDEKPVVYGRNNMFSSYMLSSLFYFILLHKDFSLGSVKWQSDNLLCCLVDKLSWRYHLNISQAEFRILVHVVDLFLRLAWPVILDHSLLVMKMGKPLFIWIKCKRTLHTITISFKWVSISTSLSITRRFVFYNISTSQVVFWKLWQTQFRVKNVLKL